MQAVDPKVTLPYWDYSIDSEELGEDWYSKSPIFRSDWFGTGNAENAYMIDEGRFANIPVGTVDDLKHAPEHNGFGLLTEAFNQSPDKYVARADSICGYPTKGRLPGCKELKGVITQESLPEMHAYLEYDFHRRLHMAVGGAWECPHNLKADVQSSSPFVNKFKGEIATQLNIIWRNMLTLGHDFFECPTVCGKTDSFEDCSCRCPSLDLNGSISYLDKDTINDYLNRVSIMFQISTGCPDCITQDSDGVYNFANLSKEEDLELKRDVLTLACHPGKIAQMGTPLAGPNDPLFFPVHNAFERLWSFMRVSPALNISWEWSTGMDDCGDMMNYEDKVPFKNFGVADEESGRLYTNKELWHLFDPANPNLPYVYDNFDWSHCEGKDDVVEFILSDGSLSQRRQR